MNSKNLLYFCLISLNLRLFSTKFVISDETGFKPFNGSNYFNLLSKLTSNQYKSSVNETNSFSESVRQITSYLNGGKEAKEPPTPQCVDTVFYFSYVLSQFIECVLTNEIQFSLCLGCSQQYSDLFNAYTDLINTSVSNCSNSFLTDEKIGLIRNFFDNSVSKWTDGNCDSCFGSKDQNRNLVVNNDTKYYFGLTQNYMDCLQSHNNSNNTDLTNSSCVLCKQEFNLVNDYYELITTNYSSHVCIDIIDSMKDLRNHWIKIMNCPADSNSSLHFLALVFIVITIPFVLYVIGKLFCVDNNKTLMKQKRLSTYHLGSQENEPLIQN